MKPIIHIGPPKTATTSLQDAVIPRLGRPYQIKPEWARQLAREPLFESPRDLEPNVIVSHESLGDFAVLGPKVIASRLGQIFKDATIVFAERDPLELFYSFYRQKLMNAVMGAAEWFATNKTFLAPRTADMFFDLELERYRNGGIGTLAMLRFETTRRIFAQRFDVRTISFDLLRSGPGAFVAAFVDICGGGPTLDLTHANETSVETMESVLALSPLNALPELRARYVDFYRAPSLTDDRADFIRDWSGAQNIDSFVKTVRFVP